jgi:hypothetical protein
MVIKLNILMIIQTPAATQNSAKKTARDSKKRYNAKKNRTEKNTEITLFLKAGDGCRLNGFTFKGAWG